jgi:fructokinase
LRGRVQIPTTTPEKTVEQVVRFFRQQPEEEPLAAIGIASFGPVDPNPGSPTFGYITTTPKPGWAFTDLAGTIARRLQVPVGLHRRECGLAERNGVAQGLDSLSISPSAPALVEQW